MCRFGKRYHDIVDISLISPAGVQIGPIPEVIGTQRFVVGDTEILLYYGEPSPFHVSQEIFIEFLPKDSYITPGIWQFVLTPRKIVTGEYDLWLPSENVLNRGTAFRYPTERGDIDDSVDFTESDQCRSIRFIDVCLCRFFGKRRT